MIIIGRMELLKRRKKNTKNDGGVTIMPSNADSSNDQEHPLSRGHILQHHFYRDYFTPLLRRVGCNLSAYCIYWSMFTVFGMLSLFVGYQSTKHLYLYSNVQARKEEDIAPIIIDPSHFAPSDHGGQAVLCCIALDEESYIDEFVDYHIGIGFNKIIIFDNSNENRLKQWGQKRHNSTAEVIHYPGINMQGQAYLDCAKGAHYNGKMKWAAFWDVDEFLVLKKHDNVDRFLDEHLSSGTLALNWHMFRQGGETIYKPLPVTKRFVYRDSHTDAHVKSIVRLRDMNMTDPPHPHYPKLINGTQHDTNGKAFEGPFNAGGPSDIAVLHHYITKSFQEYKNKRIRGRADTPNWNPSNPSPEYEQMVNSSIAEYNNALADDGNRQISGVVDDSAWRIMKKVSPNYVFYDSFDIDKPTHGLRAIITGLEHSGTTLTGSVLYNAPCVIGAFETGYLIAGTPEVIDKVNPWFGWNMAKSNVSDINYRLKNEDVETMKKAKNFMEMYDILRHRSYLFNNLSNEEYCHKPYQMIDKTPRYVYPAYFESVLQKTPGVPVVVVQKNFDKLKESWDARNSTLTQQFYNQVFDNVWKMKLKYKGRILIIHTEDLMAHPEATMQDIFEHVGLEFQTEYLQMEGLLKKFSNDIRTSKKIEQMKFKAGKHSTDRQVRLGKNITNTTLNIDTA